MCVGGEISCNKGNILPHFSACVRARVWTVLRDLLGLTRCHQRFLLCHIYVGLTQLIQKTLIEVQIIPQDSWITIVCLTADLEIDKLLISQVLDTLSCHLGVSKRDVLFIIGYNI